MAISNILDEDCAKVAHALSPFCGLLLVESLEQLDEVGAVDLVIRQFGKPGLPGKRRFEEILVSTVEGVPTVDPRNLDGLIRLIRAKLVNHGCRRVAICCLETMFLWCRPDEIVSFLGQLDRLFRAMDAKGYVVVDERMISAQDLFLLRRRLESLHPVPGGRSAQHGSRR